MTDCDVAVIGAGAVGASIAYELSLRGASVTVLDQGPGVGAGCSYANAGLLAPSHVQPLATPANVTAGLRHMWRPDSPFYIRPTPRLAPWMSRFVVASRPSRARAYTTRMQELARRSLHRHAAYSADGLPTSYQARGSVDVYLTERRLARVAAHQSGHQPLSAAQARELEPTLGPLAGAVLQPEDAHCDSKLYVAALLEAAEQRGARLRWNTPVTRLVGASGRITGLDTPHGTVRAGSYVVAGGLGSSALCRQVGLPLPMAGAKGYVIDLAVDGDMPSRPHTITEPKVVATPYPDRLRLCGTLELGSESSATSARRIAAIREAGGRMFPHLRVDRVLETWSGLRPCTADGVPAIGRTRRADNLVVAAGHGMWGLVLGPVTGQLVADGLTGGAEADALEDPMFGPDRFRGLRRRRR
jgi:D-amino-acid dehydrogenase